MTSAILRGAYHVTFILNIIMFTIVSMLAVMAPNGKCGKGLVEVPRPRLTPHAQWVRMKSSEETNTSSGREYLFNYTQNIKKAFSPPPFLVVAQIQQVPFPNLESRIG
jgi:hypothetical protein